jgi:uncharacterized membrane protein
MAQSPTPEADQQVDQLVGNLLRAGVLLAAAVVLVGGVLYLARHGGDPVPDWREFPVKEEPEVGRDPVGIVRSAVTLHGRGLIQLGLLLLILTPIARVALLCLVFLRQRDRVFVVVTLLVLAVLFFSLFSGLAEGPGR